MNKIVNLQTILKEANGYAVGSFSPRYTTLIKPILIAGQNENSPLIVQISQKELGIFGVDLKDFANEVYRVIEELNITVPICLHLDHTKDFQVIKEAIDAGFTSVMIDASEKNFENNIKITKEVVEYAKKFNVSVEAELGRIGTTDFLETDNDSTLFTIPSEAKLFVDKTGCNALAVSVGTSHGVYTNVKPNIDFERLDDIGNNVSIPLVLHGGSGVPEKMITDAIKLKKGSIKKVNIATDLEIAFLTAINRERMTSNEAMQLPEKVLEIGQNAVKNEVENKIKNYLLSSRKASINE